MNLLICWMCSTLLCLASFGSIAPVSGMFFELPDSKDDDFMGGIRQYFGSLTADSGTPDTNAGHNKTAGPVEESSGFYDEVDTALEHATDTVDGLWQQFRKGLLSLMGSFSGGDDGSDGDVPTSTPSSQQTKPISSEIYSTKNSSNSNNNYCPTGNNNHSNNTSRNFIDSNRYYSRPTQLHHHVWPNMSRDPDPNANALVRAIIR
ncbi:homeobox protein 9 [Drosophila obscura]|uniref:homeobox protein 9 n=1 Tax=Drosophila obscura TaxID=7282 RepID=UPI001BB1E764|nr:homeobox protein 9 [Drosophila obscura]